MKISLIFSYFWTFSMTFFTLGFSHDHETIISTQLPCLPRPYTPNPDGEASRRVYYVGIDISSVFASVVGFS